MWSFKRSSNLGKSHSFPSAVRGSLTIAEKTVIRPEMSREGKTRLVLKQKKTERTRRSAKSSVLGLMNLCGNSMKSYQPKSPLKVGSSRALIASSGGSTCSIGRPRRKKRSVASLHNRILQGSERAMKLALVYLDVPGS